MADRMDRHGEFHPKLDEFGREIPDPEPIAIPAGFKRPETLAEQVQRLVRRGISDHAAAHGFESFEDAEDFDVEDDGPEDPSTIYETHFDPILGREVTADEFRRNEAEYRKAYQSATDREFGPDRTLADVLREALARDAETASKGPSKTGASDDAKEDSTVHST